MTDRSTSVASYLGAAISVLSGLTLTEWGIVVGILTALLTFGANLAYQMRKDQREQRIHDLEVAHWRSGHREFPVVIEGGVSCGVDNVGS